MSTYKKQTTANNSSQQKCFFARNASALQNGQNLGWNYFAPRLLSRAHAKTSYALLPHSPALFCPFSPEAVLLTLWGTREPFRIPKALSPVPSLGRGAIEMSAKAGRGLRNYLRFRERFS
jgi:hypothetical protein